MENATKDLELHEAFAIVLAKGDFKPYAADVAQLICDKELSRESLNSLLKSYGMSYQEAKTGFLDLLLSYIGVILNDNAISEKEKHNVETLKLYFKIKEGDFYDYRYDEVKAICQKQFARTYSDNIIDHSEAVFRVEMQSIFDLSFLQMDEFKQNEIARALREGANVANLDTDRIPKIAPTDYVEAVVEQEQQGKYAREMHLEKKKILEKERKKILHKRALQELIEEGVMFIERKSGEKSREPIPKDVMNQVWNRDGGACVQCGGRDNLEFDHIIPVSKGGATTFRNLQLLCQKCNRKKSDGIG